MSNAANRSDRGREEADPPRRVTTGPNSAERRVSRGRAQLVAVAFVMTTAMSAVSAQTSTSASFRLSHQTFDASGGTASSASVRVTDCLGPEPEAGGRSTSSSFVLYAACAAAVPAGLTADDDDGDGVSNGTEDGVPNGGDGNGDGIADRAQGHVTSLPTATAAGYMTFEACGDMACSPICQVRNARALTESELPHEDPDHFFPFGLLEFALDCSRVNVRILYHGSDDFTPLFDYIKFGPNPPSVPPSRFYELPGVVFGVDMVGADSAVASARFTLTDGVIGDDTDIDGMIFDQGGPAIPVTQQVPALNIVGEAVAILVLLLISTFAFRRSMSGRTRTKHGA